MVDPLVNNVRTMIRRYERHLESGDHVLREGSQQEIGHGIVAYFHESDPETQQLHTNGHVVAPGGLGKTISGGDFIVGINTMPNGRYVLNDPALCKRVLITVPTNQLVDQWGSRLLGEKDEEPGARKAGIFGDRFNEDNIGLYHADLPDDKKREILKKAIVIATHDSARALHGRAHLKTRLPAPSIKPEEFDVVLIDEVDDKPRGDVTKEFYQEAFFPNCLIIGFTATPLFRSGKTIGDYLFGGKKPICEITHLEGVQRKEIAPHVNIIVSREIDPTSIIQPKTNRWEDYSEAEQMRFIEQTGSDNALLQVIRKGLHPKTGKPLKDMMQLHQAVNVQHGIHIAQKLNEAFGEGYAGVVWGNMDREEHGLIQRAFMEGKLKAVVQCKLWGRGIDFPPLEMTVQHAPSLSPGKIVQFHTRASRRHDGRKTAIYLSPYIEGIDQLVVGELLGGLYMLPGGYEFPPTAGKHNNPSDPEPWPNIEGIKVFYTERHLEMFARERKQQRYVDGLPIKLKNMLVLEDMAQALGIDQTILQERVYAPLQAAYEKRQSREKFVDIVANQQDVLHVRGKMFPVWRMGFYQQKAREVFCIDEGLIHLCEHTLYGRLEKAPLEVLGKENAKRLLGCDDQQIGKLWQELQHAFFHRKPYARRAEVNGLDFSYDHFGFYRNREGASEFFLFPDVLVPAYRHIYGADEEKAIAWAEQPSIRQCKTSQWLTAGNVVEALEANPMVTSPETEFVRTLFASFKSQSRGMRVGEERQAEIGKGKYKQTLRYSKQWLPLADPEEQAALCVHGNVLEWIKKELGMEPAHNAEDAFYPQRPASKNYSSRKDAKL
ncbi:MAG: DEAD/DEAH box helicase family protein [Alphaproteobacteria bacterium]